MREKTYRVNLSFTLDFQASSKEDAEYMAKNAVSNLVPGDGYVLGNTLWPEDWIDNIEELPR